MSNSEQNNKVESPIYIAGPMTGLENHNFPAFEEAATRLRSHGYHVLSPAEIADGDILCYEDCLREAIKMVIKAKTVVLLPGWEKSRGATVEVKISTGLELPLYLYDPEKLFLPFPVPKEAKETVLEEAHRITSMDRGYDYGTPIKNHGLTAQLCNLFLSAKHKHGFDLDAEDICWIMVLTKISREANSRKRDNLTDICGYVRNIEMVQDAIAKIEEEGFEVFR
jgi:hypothetical protein